MSEIKFLAFADFHYKKRMYATKVSDFENILSRAKNEGASLVVHEGDFCNDYCHSPELISKYLGADLPVFGVYGNHELETVGNTMQFVTPRLTNRPEEVIFGTADGKIGNGDVGYYYYDTGDFRFVFLDTNYSLSADKEYYEHNREASHTCPPENSLKDSIGANQLAWLDRALTDAAQKGKHCIVNAHATFSGNFNSSPDHEAVRALYKKANRLRPKTVLMSINGHYHTNRAQSIDGVFYLDLNTAINGWWQFEKFHPYEENDPENPVYTFEFTDYDENGTPIETINMPFSRLRMGAQTLFFEEPLSAVITVTSNGSITVKGKKTSWAYGKTSPNFYDGVMPEISDFSFSAE